MGTAESSGNACHCEPVKRVKNPIDRAHTMGFLLPPVVGDRKLLFAAVTGVILNPQSG